MIIILIMLVIALLPRKLYGVRVRILFLFNLFVSLGFDPCKLIKTFTNCINRHKFSEKFKTIAYWPYPFSYIYLKYL